MNKLLSFFIRCPPRYHDLRRPGHVNVQQEVPGPAGSPHDKVLLRFHKQHRTVTRMFWKTKPAPAESSGLPAGEAGLPWDAAATDALEQALSQAPVPAPLKGRVKKELQRAAEEQARQHGHATVTAEDLMQGMLAKMPAAMRAKVEDAMKQGPEGLENLKNELGK